MYSDEFTIYSLKCVLIVYSVVQCCMCVMNPACHSVWPNKMSDTQNVATNQWHNYNFFFFFICVWKYCFLTLPKLSQCANSTASKILYLKNFRLQMVMTFAALTVLTTGSSKKSAYRRHRISRPLWIVAPILFVLRCCRRGCKKFLFL